MNGIILEKMTSNFLTNLQDIFSVINNKQTKYNWLISNYECNRYPSNKIPFEKNMVFLDGVKLTNIVDNNEIQFIWGVFSAFKKNIALNEILKYSLPYADGNTEIWNTNICMQNPLAEIEIIAWDSTLTIVVAKDNEIIEQIKKYYPNAKDLYKFNSEQK